MVVWAMQGVLKPHTYVHREKHLFPTIKINVSSQTETLYALIQVYLGKYNYFKPQQSQP